MRTINKTTGEIFAIKPGGMYAPFPIPAYQVLVRLREHQATRVFVCLISHLGSNGWEVFPSYSTIAYEAGVGRGCIRKSLDILVELGFIKVATYREGKKDKNLYYIQEAAYNSLLMNKYARSYRNCDGACRRCGASLDRGGFKPTESGNIHIGCGGSVKVRGIPSKNPNRNLVLKSRVAEINAHASGVVVLNSSVSTEPIRTEPSPLGAGIVQNLKLSQSVTV